MQPDIETMLSEKLLLIVFGWLLGLLAPIISFLILDKRKSKRINASIRIELIELKHRLAMSAYTLKMGYGNFDHEFLRWLKKHISSYQGINKRENLGNFVDTCLNMTAENLEQFILSQRDPTKGKSVKYARIPFLEANLSELKSFTGEEQSLLLEILQHINIHNDLVDEARDYFYKTFEESIKDVNRQIVQSSLNEKYGQLGDRCHTIVDLIEKL